MRPCSRAETHKNGRPHHGAAVRIVSSPQTGHTWPRTRGTTCPKIPNGIDVVFSGPSPARPLRETQRVATAASGLCNRRATDPYIRLRAAPAKRRTHRSGKRRTPAAATRLSQPGTTGLRPRARASSPTRTTASGAT